MDQAQHLGDVAVVAAELVLAAQVFAGLGVGPPPSFDVALVDDVGKAIKGGGERGEAVFRRSFARLNIGH